MKEIIYFILILFLVFAYNHFESKPEGFDISFGTPPESSSSDKNNIKNLLEIGSQAQEDKKYDVVSKDILGKINRTPPPVEEIYEEDPTCFQNPYEFDYSGLKNFDSDDDNIICKNKVSVCCDLPSRKEIDMDWKMLNQSLDINFDLNFGDDIDGDIPNCCDSF